MAKLVAIGDSLTQGFFIKDKSFNPDIRDIDFGDVRFWDSLVSKPPRTLDDVFGMLKTLEKWFNISRIFK